MISSRGYCSGGEVDMDGHSDVPLLHLRSCAAFGLTIAGDVFQCLSRFVAPRPLRGTDAAQLEAKTLQEDGDLALHLV